ncbi:MAG: RDD family protein [Wenzhouxiangellaceae bacterium]|nr:RDD family protein [Wenzhouxiangellaceae bacterium]
MTVSEANGDERPCPLPRRMVAMLYDALIVVAIWMVGAALVVIPSGGAVGSGNPLFQAYLLALAFAYFYASWNFRGQTLGMRAWRIRLDAGSARPGIGCLAVRFAIAIVSALLAGAGYLWALGREDRATWHDLASRTRLVCRRR